MKVLTRIALLVILGVSCTCGQDEDLLGLPEYDIFGLDADATYYKEVEDRTNLDPEELLQKICYEYDLQLDNERINCQNIRIVPKTLQINEHSLHKREAEETPVEGSGDSEGIAPAEEPQVTQNQEPTQAPEAILQAAVAAESNGEQPPAEEQTPAEEQPSATGEEPTNETLSESEEPKEAEVNAVSEGPTDEDKKIETPVLYGEDATDGANPEPSANEDTNNEGQSSEPPANEEVSLEPDQNQVPTEATDIAETSPNPEESPASEAPVEAKEAAPVSVKKGRILSPGGTDTAKESEANAANDNTDHETIHQHQSANTVVDSSGAETLAGSDAAVKKMAAKENLKESDLPKSGESSENTQQARKDSKILVILLVAVVVIGCAAFAYNFIKKRKQKKAETRTENGNSAQQRATPADKDTEQGTELKPLMKTNDEKPVVEYNDEKAAVAK